MNTRSVLTVIAILFAAPAFGFAEVPIAEAPVYVVLLAGQSNMAGAGNFNALSESDMQRVQSAATRVSLSDNGKAAKPLTFRIAKGHLEKYGYREAFGPEMFIGITLAEANPSQRFLLIKYSVGGTSLYGAWNPHWSAEQAREVEKGEAKQNRKLFQLHIEAIRSHLSELTRQGTPFEIIGAAWMQGENDAAKEQSARSYEANLTELIAAYRNEFSLPRMPFVCGQINSNYGNFPEGPTMVRAALVNVANADTNVALIQTSIQKPPTDYPKVDGAHYNTEGQKRLGTAMGNLIQSLGIDKTQQE